MRATGAHDQDPRAGEVGRRWRPARFAAETAIALVAALAAGAAFGLILALLEAGWRPLHTADVAVVDAANSVVSPLPAIVTATRVVTHLGSPLGVGVVVAVPVIWLLIRRLPRLAAFMAVTGLGAAVLGVGVKALVERARPLVEVPLSSPSGASFPSGHAVGTAIAWGALLIVFLPAVPPRSRRAAIVAVVALVALVGLTRVALGVHYLSDVVGGWLLAVLWLSLTASAFRASLERERVGSPASGVGAVTPAERRALEPAPAHDRPLPDGLSTVARLLVAAVVLCGAVIAAGYLVTEELAVVRRLDADVVRWAAGIRTEPLTAAAMTVGWLGGVTGTITVLAFAIPLAAAITRRWRPALFLFIAAAGQGTIYLAASRLVDRDRPDTEQVGSAIGSQVSFPSGHVGASVATYGGITLLVLAWSVRRTRRWALPVAVLIVVGVALSRVYRGVHYPTDVVAGLTYGLAWLIMCWSWLQPTPR